jgi:RNA polymerase sigma factor (sigma-70 family)
MESERLRTVVASAKAGDAEAFGTLLDTYGPRLYGYFLRATGRHHDAEDLLGELMLRLVSKIEGYDDRGRFEPWVFRIAANMVRDRIRRTKAKPPPTSLSIESGTGAALAERVTAETEQVDAGLDKLDATTRQMILLRHFGQMSFREIAEVFECPLGTALARVHRGLRALRRLMGADDEAE